jgi:hypothetical protein
LKSISIPSSAEATDGSNFDERYLPEVEAGEGNTDFRLIGLFLMDFAKRKLIRYSGTGKIATVFQEIEITFRECS